MTKTALISDIHANFEALTAVFQHIDGQGDVTAVYCLGDLVGYGPNPAEVVDLVRKRCEFSIRGNHDMALTNMPLGFGQAAAQSIHWQQQKLRPKRFSLPRTRKRWRFIDSLPSQESRADDRFVHASPRDVISEYLLPADVERNPQKLNECLDLITRHCFVGHTHMPGVFLAGPKFLSSAELNNEYMFSPNQKAIVNISSVGQPRDRDPRACYAILTDAGVIWHRVEYDIEKTVEKVQAIPGLDERCGLRLREGR